jgi:hypothetical protein
MYIMLCREVIFPFLAEHANLAVSEMVCDVLLNTRHPEKQYSDAAFNVLRKAGLVAAEPVCKIIASSNASIDTWMKAVGFLGELGDRKSASCLIEGMQNVHPEWSSLNKKSAMEAGARAIEKIDRRATVTE